VSDSSLEEQAERLLDLRSREFYEPQDTSFVQTKKKTAGPELEGPAPVEAVEREGPSGLEKEAGTGGIFHPLETCRTIGGEVVKQRGRRGGDGKKPSRVIA